MSENRDSCDMRPVANFDAVFDGEPGNFCITEATLPSGEIERRMFFRLPADTGGGAILIRPAPSHLKDEPSWEWDGNREKPTLTPSVWCKGRWHGWFRAGRMESC